MGAQVVQIPFTTLAGGNFTLPHTLGVVPGSVIFEFTSSGSVWFQKPTRFDANNLYLVASGANVTGYAIVYATSSPSSLVPGQGNSTIQLQEVVDDASTLGDVAPALATGGVSMQPALSIANDVMQAIINGGPVGQPYNWKWNRYNLPVFYTNSLQQDYFIPGLVNLGWLESAWAVNINQTSVPKQNFPLEVDKDLLLTYQSGTYMAKISWLPNRNRDMGSAASWSYSGLSFWSNNCSRTGFNWSTEPRTWCNIHSACWYTGDAL